MAEVFDWVGIHEGTMFTYHQTQSDHIDEQSYLDGIELLQYDILYGERYCYKGEDKYPATNIVMGIDDILIADVYRSDTEENTINIKGKNFTMWSVVYVNGEKIPTTYVSSELLTISASKLKPGDQLEVHQNGTNDLMFRSSNNWTYVEPVNKE